MMSTEERLAGPRLTGEDGVEAAPVDRFLDGLMDLRGFRGRLMGRAWCCLNMERVIIPCSNQVGCDKDKQEIKERDYFTKKCPVIMSLPFSLHCIKRTKPIFQNHF